MSGTRWRLWGRAYVKTDWLTSPATSAKHTRRCCDGEMNNECESERWTDQGGAFFVGDRSVKHRKSVWTSKYSFQGHRPWVGVLLVRGDLWIIQLWNNLGKDHWRRHIWKLARITEFRVQISLKQNPFNVEYFTFCKKLKLLILPLWWKGNNTEPEL